MYIKFQGRASIQVKKIENISTWRGFSDICQIVRPKEISLVVEEGSFCDAVKCQIATKLIYSTGVSNFVLKHRHKNANVDISALYHRRKS